MAENSFDIVSEINYPELNNAIDQTRREVENRFDFKNSKTEIESTKDEVVIKADDEGKLRQFIDIFHGKLIKRGISLKALDYKPVEKAVGATVRQRAKLVCGIETEALKKINKLIKDSGIKVKTQNLDQKIRVTGKSKDELQEVMQLLKSSPDVTIPLQYNNFK
jgi:hypothetical protein